MTRRTVVGYGIFCAKTLFLVKYCKQKVNSCVNTDAECNQDKSELLQIKKIEKVEIFTKMQGVNYFYSYYNVSGHDLKITGILYGPGKHI